VAVACFMCYVQLPTFRRHCFVFLDTPPTVIFTLSLHDALPILFNLLTGVVALLVLPVFMVVVDATPLGDHSASDLTYLVAIFHTFFNVLGVLVMWPLEPYLSRFLQRRFQRTRARHRAPFLDANVATVQIG